MFFLGRFALEEYIATRDTRYKIQEIQVRDTKYESMLLGTVSRFVKRSTALMWDVDKSSRVRVFF